MDGAGWLVGLFHVIVHLNMQEDETVEEVHQKLQDSVWNWGQLLQATGGALKGSKCFFHLLSFGYHADGTWYYQAMTRMKNLR